MVYGCIVCELALILDAGYLSVVKPNEVLHDITYSVISGRFKGAPGSKSQPLPPFSGRHSPTQLGPRYTLLVEVMVCLVE